VSEHRERLRRVRYVRGAQASNKYSEGIDVTVHATFSVRRQTMADE
jgi:hypothetical protein